MFPRQEGGHISYQGSLQVLAGPFPKSLLQFFARKQKHKECQKSTKLLEANLRVTKTITTKLLLEMLLLSL